MKNYENINFGRLQELNTLSESVLIDVREDWEFEEFNIGGINIPMNSIRERRNELILYKNLIVVCTNGSRSKIAAKDYCRASELIDADIYHLEGGILGIEYA